jgi:hypothetical protein
MRRTSLEIAANLIRARFSLKRRAFLEIKKEWAETGSARAEGPSRENIREAVFLARETRRIAGRLPIHCDCLVQSVALMGMLKRRGLQAHLRFGVRKDGKTEDSPFAHAWVEYGEYVILDTGNRNEFVPFG